MVLALVKGVDKLGLKPESFVGGHGSRDLTDVVQAAQKVQAAAAH